MRHVNKHGFYDPDVLVIYKSFDNNHKTHCFLFLSGSNKAIDTLHDPLIAEKSRAVADKIGVNDEDVNKTAKTDPNQLKENTMFFYCGWQLFCLLLVIFSVYGTYQNM